MMKIMPKEYSRLDCQCECVVVVVVVVGVVGAQFSTIAAIAFDNLTPTQFEF